MSDCVWLLRHGDTEWSEHERHTGLRDIPLSERGREQARRAGERLGSTSFDNVLVSPLSRARETCRLAGFGEQAAVCDDLVEWDYGEYEGLTDAETEARRPGWNLFRHGAPGGESPEAVLARIDRVLAIVEELPGRCLLVGHGKLFRALAAAWIGTGVESGSSLALDPAAVAILERECEQPLLRLWNYAGELSAES